MPILHDVKDKVNSLCSPFQPYQIIAASIAVTLTLLYLVNLTSKFFDPRQPGLSAKLFRLVISLPIIRGIAKKELDKAVSIYLFLFVIKLNTKKFFFFHLD